MPSHVDGEKGYRKGKGWMDWKDGMGVMMIVECQLSCCYFAGVWCLVVRCGVLGCAGCGWVCYEVKRGYVVMWC